VDVGYIPVYTPLPEMALPDRDPRLRLRSMRHFPTHPGLVQTFCQPHYGKGQACQRSQIGRQKCNVPQRTPLREKPLQSQYMLDRKVDVVSSVLTDDFIVHSHDRFIPGTRSRAIAKIPSPDSESWSPYYTSWPNVNLALPW